MSLGWIQVLLGVLAILILPVLALAFRAAIKWTRMESRMEGMMTLQNQFVKTVTGQLEGIVKDKDETHRAIFDQMREDRAATDRRLRWLEEHLWKSKPLCGTMD